MIDGERAFPHGTFDLPDDASDGRGMSLRDYFAAAALNQRKMLSTGAWYAADAAREAYEIADAMLAERQKAVGTRKDGEHD